MTRRQWSLATRLTAWYAATAFLLVVGAAVMQYRALVTNLAREDDQVLREWLVAARAARSETVAIPSSLRVPGVVVRFLDPACQASPGSSAPDLPPPVCPDQRTGEPVFRTWRSADGRTWRVAAVRAEEPAGGGGWIEVLLDSSGDDAIVRSYREELVLVLGAAFGLAVVLGYAIARRGLVPLTALRERIRRIDARSLNQRLGGTELPAEIAALVSSFDAMLERLEAAFRAVGEVSADLAHEIRTPLHLLCQQAEVALTRARTPEEYREVLGSSLEQLDRVRRMADNMLFLARTEDPQAVIRRQRVEVALELRQVADYFDAMATEQQVAIETDAPADLGLAVDQTLLRRALVNLVGNALRHTPAGGRVRMRGQARDGAVIVEVEDTGEGIPAELLARVFDRHFRAPSTRAVEPDRSGLGLAIVRGIMRLHSGTAVITSSPGEGTKVTLTFPQGVPAAV